MVVFGIACGRSADFVGLTFRTLDEDSSAWRVVTASPLARRLLVRAPVGSMVEVYGENNNQKQECAKCPPMRILIIIVVGIKPDKQRRNARKNKPNRKIRSVQLTYPTARRSFVVMHELGFSSYLSRLVPRVVMDIDQVPTQHARRVTFRVSTIVIVATMDESASRVEPRIACRT